MICSTCKKDLHLECFMKRKDSKTGYREQCKDCFNLNRRKWHKETGYGKKEYAKNKEQELIKAKVYYQKKKEEIKEKSIKYYHEHKDKIREYKKERQKYKIKNDIKYKLAKNLRNRLYYTLQNNTKHAPTLELIGCSIENFKNHIESQFTSEMNWGNYGKEWDIDHSIPLSILNLEIKEEQEFGMNFKNCKPLNSKLNRSKYNYINPQLQLLLDRILSNPPELHISKKEWQGLSDHELSFLTIRLCQYYQSRPFPIYNLSESEMQAELAAAKRYIETSNLWEDKTLKPTSHLGGTCWTFFPHFASIPVNNKPSMEEYYNNPETLKKAIFARLKYGDFISNSGIRKVIRAQYGTQGVSNFRPLAAYAIYQKYCLENAIVWDMSGGFGGRYMGAFLSPKVSRYITTEPSTKTYEGLVALSTKFYKRNSIYQCGSEEFLPEKESLDVCFSSPPYFNCERYADEPSQSYIKYPDKWEWFNRFLVQTIKNCYYGLKKDGYLILNIANVATFKDLVPNLLEVMPSLGFELEDTLYLGLRRVSMKKGSEPIFVFKKKSLDINS